MRRFSTQALAQQRDKALQCQRQFRSFDRGSAEVGKPNLDENGPHSIDILRLSQVGHNMFKELGQFRFAMSRRGEILRKCPLAAQRLTNTIWLHRPGINSSAKIIQFGTKLAEFFEQLKTRIALEIATGMYAQLC